MAVFLDLSESRPKKAERTDVKLMCAKCQEFTLHHYDHTLKLNKSTQDVMYGCAKCGASRRYGREETELLSEVIHGDKRAR